MHQMSRSMTHRAIVRHQPPGATAALAGVDCRQCLARDLLPTIAQPKRPDNMGLSQSSSRTMRWSLPWRRIEGVLPYLLFLAAGLMLIAAVWSERRSADEQSDL